MNLTLLVSNCLCSLYKGNKGVLISEGSPGLIRVNNRGVISKTSGIINIIDTENPANIFDENLKDLFHYCLSRSRLLQYLKNNIFP